MALHRLILRPRSPWGTPFRSDTLLGLLLYRLAEDEGEAALRAELEAFRSGNPPFSLSSAMPEGTMFFPRLPSAGYDQIDSLMQKQPFHDEKGRKLSRFEVLSEYKKFSKMPFMPIAFWEKHRGALSSLSLFREYLEQPDLWKRSENVRQQSMHVTIDRRSGTAVEGGLFASSSFWAPNGSAFHLYAETEDCPRLLQRLERLGQLGYGRDSSTGKGVFSIEEDPTFEAAVSSDMPHRLLISLLSAANLSGLEGYYATEVKIGKAGPGFCRSNPFKRPFILVSEGSLLTSMPKGPFVLNAIHADPSIVQITQPLALPCRLAEEENDHE